MANRFPLVFDTTGKSLEELPTGDNLDLTGSSVVNAINITGSGQLNIDSISTNSISLNGNSIANIATTSDYNDLINKPILFSGDYNDLANKPSSFSADWDDITNKPVIATKLSQLANDTNFVSNAQINITTNQVTDLAEIATTGSFNSLSDVPNFVTNEQIVGGTLTVEVSNTGDLVGSVFADDSTLMLDHINNELNANKVRTDVIEANDFSLLSDDGFFFETPGFMVFRTQSFEILNNNAGTYISDQDRIFFTGNIDFSNATTTGLALGQEITGNFKGSVFGDDSSVLVDAINNKLQSDTVDTNTLTATTVKTQDINTTASMGISADGLTVTSTNGIQLLAGGIFNVPNATQVTLSASAGITLNSTNDLVLTSTSGVVDFPSGTAVDFTGATVTGLNIGLEGDLRGSVFADNSTLLVDGVNGIVPAEVVSGDLSVNTITTPTITAANLLSITSPGTLTLGSSNNNTVLLGTTGTGTVNIGSGSNTINIATASTFDASNITINFADSSISGLASTEVDYTPGNSGHWDGTPPTTVGEALDRLAAWIQNNGGGAEP